MTKQFVAIFSFLLSDKIQQPMWITPLIKTSFSRKGIKKDYSSKLFPLVAQSQVHAISQIHLSTLFTSTTAYEKRSLA